jgi:hypothetical protein
MIGRTRIRIIRDETLTWHDSLSTSLAVAQRQPILAQPFKAGP